MADKIYSQKVFDTQANSTVFAREGIIDELPSAGPGIYQSWKYNWENGKQVFRANGNGKIYEKRLVKDSYGVPRWTGWMEIPDAEARGIMAISFNGGVANLPNADGFFNMQLTPGDIDAFTRRETENLVSEKIAQVEERQFIYVPWPYDEAGQAKNISQKEVLDAAIPVVNRDTNLTYICSAYPNANPGELRATANSFIYEVVEVVNEQNIYDWIQIGSDVNGTYVTFTNYDLHRKNLDKEVDAKHVTAEELASLKAAISDSATVRDHIRDHEYYPPAEDVKDKDGNVIYHYEPPYQETIDGKIETPLQLHVTPEEKEIWNNKLEGLNQGAVEQGSRYVLVYDQVKDPVTGTVHMATTYKKALEQDSLANERPIDYSQEDLLGSADAHGSYTFKTKTKYLTGDWAARIKSLVSAGAIIDSLILSYDGLNKNGSSVKFVYNDGLANSTELTVPQADSTVEIKVPYIVGRTDIGAPIYISAIQYSAGAINTTIQNLTMKILYSVAASHTLNDQTSDLDIQFTTLYLNGEEFAKVNSDGGTTWDLDIISHWGRIAGNIEEQTDLTAYIKSASDNKMNINPDSSSGIGKSKLRYDAIGKGNWIPSLAQHSGDVVDGVELPVYREESYSQLQNTRSNAIFFNNVDHTPIDQYIENLLLAHPNIVITDVLVELGDFVFNAGVESFQLKVDNVNAPPSRLYRASDLNKYMYRKPNDTDLSWKLGPITDFSQIQVINPPANPDTAPLALSSDTFFQITIIYSSFTEATIGQVGQLQLKLASTERPLVEVKGANDAEVKSFHVAYKEDVDSQGADDDESFDNLNAKIDSGLSLQPDNFDSNFTPAGDDAIVFDYNHQENSDRDLGPHDYS
jgi:hypothetical protein